MAKVTIDIINSKWEVSKEEKELLYEINSAEARNKFFNRSFRQHYWTGKVSLYSPVSGTLPTGLVEDSIISLKECGFPVETIYKFSKEFSLPDRKEGKIRFSLSDHQLRALDAMCCNKRGIIHAATNAGKTKIAEAWCALHKVRVLYLVPSKELLRQTVESFKKDTNLSVGSISAEGGWHLGEDVTVCLTSSVVGRKSRFDAGKKFGDSDSRFRKIAPLFEAVIVDECHHAISKTYTKILKELKNCEYRYGMSGTPWEKGEKEDELKTRAYLGPVIAEIFNTELIELGWSAKPLIKIVSVPRKTFPEANLDYKEVYDRGIIYNTVRNNQIVKICREFSDRSETCLVIASRVDQCKSIGDLLQAIGVDYQILIGENASEDRKLILSSFKEGEFPVLISTLLNEGVDIPSLNGLVFASGGKGSKQLLQRVGRGVRKKHSGENSVRVYDFHDSGHRILERHSKRRRELFLEEGFEIEDVEVLF